MTILPLAANSDNSAWSLRWRWNGPFEGRMDSLRKWLQESHTSRAFAGNLLNLPSYVIHGSGDDIVPPEHARETVRELRRLQCPVEYREYPGVGHGGFPGYAEQQGLSWLCSFPRRENPRKVTWKADLLKHGKAYWIRFEEKALPTGFMSARAVAESRTSVRL